MPHDVAARLLDLWRAAGIDDVFGVPGVHNLPFWSADGAGPTIRAVRHEQTAAYAADGLSRATGGVGVALTTTGPGAANTLAAVGEAAAAGSAVVVVSSEVAGAHRAPGFHALHGMADQGALFEPLAKAVLRATTPDDAVALGVDALTLARTPPAGPVYLGVPADVLAQEAPSAHVPPAPTPRAPDLRAVEHAAATLGRAPRVVVWAGGGCVAADAGRALTDLAWRLGAPVVTTYAARGLLGSDHPLLVDAPPHEPAVAELIASADLLLVVGSRLDAMTTRNGLMPRPPALVRVDVDEHEAHLGWPADAVVVGDAALTCDALATRVAPREPWADQVFRLRHTVRAEIAHDPRTAQAAALLDAVDGGWPAAGSVVCDMAVASYWVGGYAAMARPRRLQYPVGWGTLGYALPAAVGAAVGSGRPVLAVAGDGGVPFAVGELATLVQERLPVTLLVVDDGGYGMLRYDQRVAGHPERGVDLAGPDWLALAAAFGVRGRAVDLDGLGAALADAAASHAPTLLHLPVALFPPRTTSPRWGESA